MKKLQNKATKIITNTCPRERVTPHYCKLERIKLDDRYQFELAKLMNQFIHNKLYLVATAITLCTHPILILTPPVIPLKITYTYHAFQQLGLKIVQVRYAKLWNIIPYDIKQLSFAMFKIAYKNLLLETHI